MVFWDERTILKGEERQFFKRANRESGWAARARRRKKKIKVKNDSSSRERTAKADEGQRKIKQRVKTLPKGNQDKLFSIGFLG